jgi:hypothetical protein
MAPSVKRDSAVQPHYGAKAAALSVASFAVYLLAGCCPHRSGIFPLPFPSAPTEVLRGVVSGFDVVYPPEGGVPRQAGLVSPRLGIPALVGPRPTFEIEILERSRAPVGALRAVLVAPDSTPRQVDACLRGTDGSRCVPLQATRERRETGQGGPALRTITVASSSAVAPAAWDLVVRVGSGPAERQPRCVFSYTTPPEEPRPFRLVHLSDLHLGKHPCLDGGQVPALHRVLAAINEAAPDLVVLTGDIIDNGADEEWLDRARSMLLGVHAPLLIVPGNHDHSHFPKVLRTEAQEGWLRFARLFHARRRTRLVFRGWELLGIDTGPSLFSTRIMTRGVGGDTIQWLHARLGQARTAGHGIVVYGHAPTRTGPMLPGGDADKPGQIGHMWYGASQLEEALQVAADGGARVLYLAGHTHWLEVHLLRPASTDPGGRWRRLSDGELPTCRPLEVKVQAAMITVPSATHVTFRTLSKGRHSGFAIIELGSSPPVVRLGLFDRRGEAVRCSGPGPGSDEAAGVPLGEGP